MTDQPHDDGRLDLAREALKQYHQDRWVEVSDRVLRAALTATRRSRPVRGHAAGGTLQVDEQVVVAYLRDAIDDAVPGTAVQRIHVVLDVGDRLDSVVVEIIVRYGLPILPAADRIREIAARVLDDVLGRDALAVDLRVTHVHVGDVTVDDPAVSGPTGPGTRDDGGDHRGDGHEDDGSGGSPRGPR